MPKTFPLSCEFACVNADRPVVTSDAPNSMWLALREWEVGKDWGWNYWEGNYKYDWRVDPYLLQSNWDIKKDFVQSYFWAFLEKDLGLMLASVLLFPWGLDAREGFP